MLYLDDIIVFSSSVQQHVHQLRVVLGRLKAEGLKVKLKKCEFLREEVSYLGHVISSQGGNEGPKENRGCSPVASPYNGVRQLLASCPNEIVAIDFSILELSRSGQENLIVMTREATLNPS